MASGKMDRRTRYTKGVIREAFFTLLREKGFDKISVTDICRLAEINRGTFYLHYVDKFELLDEVIDEALEAEPPLDGAEVTSMCQRPPANDDYRLLYTQPDLFARVSERVIERSAAEVVPQIMEKTGLSPEDARVVFAFVVNGNLAVNRMLGWERTRGFAEAQQLLRQFVEGGYGAIRQDERQAPR